jgi:hypothetical protein
MEINNSKNNIKSLKSQADSGVSSTNRKLKERKNKIKSNTLKNYSPQIKAIIKASIKYEKKS